MWNAKCWIGDDWEHHVYYFPLLSEPIKSYERNNLKSEAQFHDQLVHCGKNFSMNFPSIFYLALSDSTDRKSGNAEHPTGYVAI